MLDGSGRILLGSFSGNYCSAYANELAKKLNVRLPKEWFATDKNELNRVLEFPETKYLHLSKILDYEDFIDKQIIIFIWIDKETADKDNISDYGTKVPVYLSYIRDIIGEKTRVFVIDGSRRMVKAEEMSSIIIREIGSKNPVSMSIKSITPQIFKELTIVEIV